MPDHHLHPYFRFLVDHQDLLQSKEDGQPENEEKTSNSQNAAGAGALSLLGSVYGTGEDEDGVAEPVSGNTVNLNVNATSSLASSKTASIVGRDESVSKHSLPSKEDASYSKNNSLTNSLKAGRASSLRKEESSGLLSAASDKLRASSLPPIAKTEHMVLEPPSEMKRLVEKIVEFIIKNGRQFEAVLMEQDRGHGRFPFLIPSNIFHLYYLKVLQKAQESNLTVKSFHNEKEDFKQYALNKKRPISKNSETCLVESDDIPLDYERKEKFKMVINKSKREGSDLPSKSTQLGVQVDAAQAAAILQAATRGIKHPNLDFLTKSSLNNEADSSEAHLTHEQKLKAERLKRAKMFVAMLKSGAAPTKTEPSRGLSAEPEASGASGKERERSSAPSDFDTLDKKIKSEKEHLNEERRAKRKYRARSGIDEEGEAAAEEEEYGSEMDNKHEKKRHKHRHRHRSHRSSHKHDENDKTDEEEEQERELKHSRKKHRSHHSSHDEDSHDEGETDHKYSRKKRSSHEEDDSKDERHHRRKHRSHKHRKHHSSRHKKKLDVSSEKADKHRTESHSERGELEEGEISSKASGQSRGERLASREPSADVSSSHQTEVPDDLRAKIRAMLMSTMVIHDHSFCDSKREGGILKPSQKGRGCQLRGVVVKSGGGEWK